MGRGQRGRFREKSATAQYENTRAQFEDFAANGWATHKMTVYWRLNDGWPSFFAGIYGYDMNPGGAYYGAKQGLKPLSIVFDYYATDSRRQAKVQVTNQTMQDRKGLRARVRIYALDGKVRYDKTVDKIDVKAQGVALALAMPRVQDVTSTYFVRCELFGPEKTRIADNVSWQSTVDDDVRDSTNDSQFLLKQVGWADFSALGAMAKVPVEISASLHASGGRDGFTVTLRKRPLNEQCWSDYFHGSCRSASDTACAEVCILARQVCDGRLRMWGSAGVGTVVESSEEIRFPLGMFIRNACDSHPLKDLADGLHEDVLQRSKASIMPQIPRSAWEDGEAFLDKYSESVPLRGG
jgi:hypothetical protein